MPDEIDPDAGEGDTDTVVVTPDVSAYVAKIAALEAESAAKDVTIAGLVNQVTMAKAANYDLLMLAPNDAQVDSDTTDNEPDETDIDIDDLFGDEEK